MLKVPATLNDLDKRAIEFQVDPLLVVAAGETRVIIERLSREYTD